MIATEELVCVVGGEAAVPLAEVLLGSDDEESATGDVATGEEQEASRLVDQLPSSGVTDSQRTMSVADMRRALSEQLLTKAGLDPRVRQRFRITEPEVILDMIWQGQAEGENLNNAPEVLANQLRDYLLGKGEPLVFYEEAEEQVADWLAMTLEGWGELLGRPVPDVVASFFKTVSNFI